MTREYVGSVPDAEWRRLFTDGDYHDLMVEVPG